MAKPIDHSHHSKESFATELVSDPFAPLFSDIKLSFVKKLLPEHIDLDGQLELLFGKKYPIEYHVFG